MLRGFQWGLYLFENRLVRAKIDDDNFPLSVDIVTLGKCSIYESKPLSKKINAKLEQIDFPEDSRLGNLINRRHYKSGLREVELIEVDTDAEYGGIFAEVSAPDLPVKQREFIPLKKFLDDYHLVQF